MKYRDSNLFINRELSWLEFNERVLEEAFDKTNPLLERLKFLAITASNLDEFFMVRVAGLNDQIEAGYNKKDPSGLTPREQLKAISDRIHEMVEKQYRCLQHSIFPKLEKEMIFFVTFEELNKEQKEFTKHYFDRTIYPVLTPMAVDQSRPFPLISNKSLNLGVRLENEEGEEFFAIVQVPAVLPRIITIPSKDKKVFMFLSEIIRQYMDQLFHGHKIKAIHSFRITRNADLSIDEEEAEDLLIEIEKSIKGRKWGAPVRLEIEKKTDEDLRQFFVQSLELKADEIYEVPGPIDLTVWMKFSGLEGFDHLRYEPKTSQFPKDFQQEEDIFEVIRKKDIMVHHPYESFDCVVGFVRKAAEDPRVLAIKQTLYRISGDSPIVKALIQAAENGKQVTVLVELKARFDEENNILWARRLEKAGCHVVYGLVGLKTHCKVLLIVRKETDGIRRYVHLGTGNYNDKTAKLYTDIGMFTSKESYGADASALFNLLTGYSQAPHWKKLSVAPTTLRETFLHWIENEIDQVKQGRKGRIIAKMNSLVDQEIIQALYRASSKGVEIDLIVRGICSLRSGVKGISDNIRVISIVGRFLEHSRIYYFENGDHPKVFLSSADWMSRNLNRRVEVLFPVEQEDLKQRIQKILDIMIRDTIKARVQKVDGTYERIDKRGKEVFASQEVFYEMAEQNEKQGLEQPGTEVFQPKTRKEAVLDCDKNTI